MAGLFLIAALASGLSPADERMQSRVDVIERNYVYNDLGELAFAQLIFWDWCERAGRFQVRDWRLCRTPHLGPQRLWPQGQWQVTILTDRGVCVVYAASFRETWTQYDVELLERDILPEVARRRLR